MDIIPTLRLSVKDKIRKRFQNCRIAAVRIRYLILFNFLARRGAREIQSILHVHNTTVYRVAKRFREHGEAALWDGHGDNGSEKLTEAFLGILDQFVRSSPLDHG